MSRTFILNLFLILSKYVQVSLKVLHPQKMCHTPSVIDINRVNVGGLFQSSRHRHPHDLEMDVVNIDDVVNMDDVVNIDDVVNLDDIENGCRKYG